ncbi:MAG: patatin-like phospholipase family protein [Pseudomonadota bacterium]
MRPGQFQQLVFSGGGTRCFWQGGFLNTVREPLNIVPQRITGVSGGALSAASFIARNGEKVLRVMGDAFEANARDRQVPLAILRGKSAHERIYRSVVAETMDVEAVDAIANGPQFHITLSVPPQWLPTAPAVYLSFLAYKLDQTVRSNPHISLPGKLGARNVRVDARQAARDGVLVDLICAAATIPPVFSIVQWPPQSGPFIMDGGTTDNAPMPHPDEGDTLVLMTRRYRRLPANPHCVYVEPTTPVPASKLDFTDRTKIERGWAIGQADGERFLKANGLAS